MANLAEKRPVWFKDTATYADGSIVLGRVDEDNTPYVKHPGKPEQKASFMDKEFMDMILGGEEISQEEYETDKAVSP